MKLTMKHMPTAQDLAPLQQVMDPAMPPTLREIAENLFVVLLLAEPAKPVAARAMALAQLALLQLEQLCATMGGMNWYLNKGVVLKLSRRNRDMCAKFRGDYKVLAREYDLTEQQVRNIVDAWQHQEFARRQNPLFGDVATAHKRKPKK